MKKETMFAIGLGVVGIIGLAAYSKASVTDEHIKELMKTMDRMSDNIDVDISEKLVDRAVKVAADKAVKVAADKAAKKITEDIDDYISDGISEAISNIKPEIRHTLEKQITMLDLEDIKNDVVKKTAGIVAENISIPGFLSSRNNTADVVKACVDADMDSWEIQNILKTMQK